MHALTFDYDVAVVGAGHAGVEAAFASARATVHVPRGPYARSLPGIPTIRMFEALACGIPVASAPWDDIENLFPRGTYLSVADGAEMKNALQALLHDRELAAALITAGLQTIAERHTCRHRALELLGIVDSICGARHSETATRLQEALS